MSLEKYVRSTQLVEQPKARPERSATVRPGARLATGGTAVVRPHGQLPFRLGDYAALSGSTGGGGNAESTPLPVGDSTLIGHSSGSPVDISGSSSLVLRMNSPLHILPLTVSSRNVGGNRVFNCKLFVEVGDVNPQLIFTQFNSTNIYPVEIFSDGSKRYRLDSGPIFDVVVSQNTGSAEAGFGERGVHYELFPVQISGYDYTGADFPEFFGKINGEINGVDIVVYKKYFDDFPNYDPRLTYKLLANTQTMDSAVLQIVSEHGHLSPSFSGIDSDFNGLTEDNNGNPRRTGRYYSTKLSINPIRRSQVLISRASWVGDVTYFERTDEFLISSALSRSV
jgi:hypothetical protein